MAITALPTPPTRSDPVNFASRADTFLAALPTFQAEANATAAAMNLNSTTDTSVSSVLIGTGAKTFAVTAGKSFQPGMYLVIAATASPSTNSMWGQVTSYSGTALVMNVMSVIGSGTLAAWTISQSAPGVNWSSPSPIGGAVPAAGAFTTLSATGGVVFPTGVNMTSNEGQTRFGFINGGATYLLSPGGYSFRNSSNVEQMALDAAGNLGLGVVPSAWDSSIYKAVQLAQGVALASYLPGSNPILELCSNSYYNAGYKKVGYGPSALYTQNNGSHNWYTSPAGSAGAPITFTQAMTLDASGTLLVGATSVTPTNTGSFVLASGAGAYGGVLAIQHSTSNIVGSGYLNFNYNGGAIGSVTQSGTTSVAYNTTSDYRLKENVRPSNAARFMDIEFVDFEWVDGRHDCGVIAGQLQSVYPDLVRGEVDATEIRQVEITPAVPAVTEQVLVSPAIKAIAEVVDADGVVTQEAVAAVEAVYETVKVTPAVPAVTEDQTFPVYQQVNYIGLIGRMGTRVQQLQRTVDAQAALLESVLARLAALEA